MNTFLRKLVQTGLAICFMALFTQSLFGQEVAPEAINDDALGNEAGSIVTVDVVANDVPTDNWVTTTVRIIDPSDFVTQLTSYVEPDQGIWTVNGDGSISFSPCTAVGVPDTSCTDALKFDPFPIDYVVQDSQGNLSNPAIVTIAYDDKPLSVSLAYFHSVPVGDEIEFTWVTAVETGTTGFNLFVETAEGLDQINQQLIPSPVVTSIVPQGYFHRTAVTGEIFYLHEVSIDGANTEHGPFVLGEEYGINPLEDDGTSSNDSTTVFLPIITVQAQ